MLTDVSRGYVNFFSSQEHGYLEKGYWKTLIYSKNYLIIMATVVKELRIILMMVMMMMMMIKFSHGTVNQSKD